jgi:WD40 repeat protein
LNRGVAIKELLRPTPSGEARFLREIQATVKLQHPNIVSIHEAGRWPDGQLFYAMNFVAGKTLLDEIRETRDTPSRIALLPKVVDVAEALAFAHSQGVVHRDLKPVNVLVGPFGETVVIDWGLAKFVAEPAFEGVHEVNIPRAGFTRTGLVVGSPPYLPPEQARGEEVDETCDVYAIGAMLYHVLSGKAPYAEVAAEAQLEQIRKGPPKPLGQIAPDLPKDLLAIVDKAMARLPVERYPNAKALVEELQRFTRGLFVSAYEYGFKDRLKRFVQRNLAAVIVAFVAIVVIVVLGTISLVSVRLERDVARQNEAFAHEQLNLAEQRARTLVVSQAASRTDSDPTLAIAWLKRLDDPVAGAPSVAARAEEYGVARWILRGHTDSINCTAVSPDGKTIVSGSDDHTLMAWTLGAEQQRTLRRHSDRVTDCEFSPDGRWLASASYDGNVILWNTQSWQPRALPNQGDAVKSLAFSPDSQHLASLGANNRMRIWRLSDGSVSEFDAPSARWPFVNFYANDRVLSGPHEGRVRSWRLDGSFVQSPMGLAAITIATPEPSTGAILLGTQAGELLEWNPLTDDVTPITQLGSPLSALATRQAETGYAAVATMAGDVVDVDLTRKEAHDAMRHTERVLALAVSPDQRFIASGGWDRGVRLYDVKSNDTRLLRGHSDVISDLVFTPDSRYLITASWDKTLRVWPLDDALHLQRRVLRGHQIGVHSVRFSPDGRLIASGGHDDTVRLWNTADGSSRVLRGHEDHVYRVLFSPDGKQLASSSDDKTIRIWNTKDGSCTQVLKGHEADVEELAFSPDGKHLVSGSEDQTARIWDLSSGESKVLFHDHAVTGVAFHPSGALFATGSRAGDVRVFDLSGKQTAVYDEQGGEVFAVAFSPDGRWLASSGTTGSLTLREVGTRKAVRWTTLPGARGVEFSPDGRYLAVSGTSTSLWLCEIPSVTCNELRAHQSQVRGMRFLPDSRALVTAGGDGNLLLWDVETFEHRVYEGHRAPIFDVDVSPDGAWIATASGDETVRVWPKVPVSNQSSLLGRLSELTQETLSGVSDVLP